MYLALSLVKVQKQNLFSSHTPLIFHGLVKPDGSYYRSRTICVINDKYSELLDVERKWWKFLQPGMTIDFSFTMSKIDNLLLFLADMRTGDAYDDLYQGTIERIGHLSSRTERRRIGYKQRYFKSLIIVPR